MTIQPSLKFNNQLGIPRKGELCRHLPVRALGETDSLAERSEFELSVRLTRQAIAANLRSVRGFPSRACYSAIQLRFPERVDGSSRPRERGSKL